MNALSILATVFALFFVLFRGIFTDESAAMRALGKQGYTEVQVTGKQWFMVTLRGCGRSDAAKFTVQAKNPRGQEVEVFVCVGWPFKGSTIRTD